MNLKSKLFGFGAAAVLSLSMATGGMAADDSTVARVKLNPGACGVEITSSNANFGNWKWDGATGEYQMAANATASYQVAGTVTNAAPDGTCYVSVTSDGLTGVNNGDVISASNLAFHGIAIPNLPAGAAISMTGGSTLYEAPLSIKVPNTVQPDTYRGTINFAISDTQ